MVGDRALLRARVAPVGVDDLEVAATAAGSGAGTGSHWTSEWLPGLRGGRAPVWRYAAMRSSVHVTPDSEPACVVPPTPSIRTACGNVLRVWSAPEYGVAASSVSLIIKRLLTPRPSTLTGRPAL